MYTFHYISFIYITGLVSPLHDFAMAYVFPSEQQPNSLPAHEPIKLDCDVGAGSELLVLLSLGTGTIPLGQGLVDLPSSQHQYCSPTQPFL